MSASRLLAQITNPAVPSLSQYASGDSATTGNAILQQYIGVGVKTAIILGSLGVLVYFFLGAIAWLTSGGDKGDLEKARSQMVNAVVGLLIMLSIVAFVGVLGPTFFGFDILNLEFVNQIQTTGGVTNGACVNIPGVGTCVTQDQINSLTPQQQQMVQQYLQTH